MGQPYIGEIRLFAGNFEPNGWMFCDGRVMDIATYDVLFNLIGTTYGGDGVSTYNLPDLRGRVPIHQGNGYTMGEAAGTESVTVTTQQMPAHSHVPAADAQAGTSADPVGHLWANSGGAVAYSHDAGGPGMAPGAMLGAGGSQPHENMQPFLCVNFIIALFGIFPSPT